MAQPETLISFLNQAATRRNVVVLWDETLGEILRLPYTVWSQPEWENKLLTRKRVEDICTDTQRQLYRIYNAQRRSFSRKEGEDGR